MAEKIKIKISQILEDLSNGIDRKGIGAKYGLKASDVSRLFQDERLKGKRVKPAPGFEIEEEENGSAASASVETETALPKTKGRGKAKSEVSAPASAEASSSNMVIEEEDEKSTPASDTPGEGIKEVKTPEDDVATTKW